MTSRNDKTTRIVIVAFFIAAEIVLTRYFSIMIAGEVRIGFGFLPVAMLACMYGPLWAGAAYAIGDILGMLIWPSGAFFPGFTLTAFLTGVVFGLFLYKKEVRWTNVLPATLIICLGLNLGLDTLWLTILLKKGFLLLLPLRVFKCAVIIPVQLVLIPLVWHTVMKKIPYVKSLMAN